MKELKEWIINYLKSRDAIKKEIISIKANGDIIVETKNKTRKYIVHPTIPDDILLDNHISIVTYNTKQNFDWLLSKWNKLASYDDLSIYFINPKSTTEDKWIIFPHTHAKISEKESFKLGLESLFRSVEPYHARH